MSDPSSIPLPPIDELLDVFEPIYTTVLDVECYVDVASGFRHCSVQLGQVSPMGDHQLQLFRSPETVAAADPEEPGNQAVAALLAAVGKVALVQYPLRRGNGPASVFCGPRLIKSFEVVQDAVGREGEARLLVLDWPDDMLPRDPQNLRRYAFRVRGKHQPEYTYLSGESTTKVVTIEEAEMQPARLREMFKAFRQVMLHPDGPLMSLRLAKRKREIEVEECKKEEEEGL